MLIFALLLAAIVARPAKWLNDFDQSFYLTIAYDLDRHGVFSNGIFDDVDSTAARPQPGMFFGPLYPSVVAAAMRIDRRFAGAVVCAVESNHGKRDRSTCDIYALPMHVLHAVLLAAGVLAIACAAEFLFAGPLVFYLAGALAAAALLPDADLFSFVMTESAAFGLYGMAALAWLIGLKTRRAPALFVAGLLLGMLALARPSFAVLAPLMAVLVIAGARMAPRQVPRRAWAGVLGFGLGFALLVVPWMARNAVALGKWGLTEEYGSAVVIERMAYNTMTAREFALSFAYCVPELGPWAVARWFGNAMARFDWREPHGFFQEGRARRVALVKEHGRLDPIVGSLLRAELHTGWWRHLLTTLPLAWCGLWVGQVFGLLLIPLFAWSLLRALRERRPLFLLYALSPAGMLVLHAAIANPYVRYNLILIGPAAVGGAWIMADVIRRIHMHARRGAEGGV